MRYEYFIASRFRNKDVVLELARQLREKGKSVYCFFETVASRTHVGDLDSDPEQAMTRFEAVENWQDDSRVREVFETDMEALKNSQTVLLLLPAGKSAHLEAGIAYGLGKKCILVGEQKETETLYLIFDKHFPTIDAALKLS